MSCRSGDVGWPQGLDVAFGVCRDLAGISRGQAGLSSGGAAQVGLVHSNMTHQPQRYKPCVVELDAYQVDRGKG